MFITALDVSLRIVAAAAAVGLVLVVLRVRSGAARHAAWSAVLVAMLLMPVLMAIVPKVEVPVPSALALDLGAIAGETRTPTAPCRRGRPRRSFRPPRLSLPPPAPTEPKDSPAPFIVVRLPGSDIAPCWSLLPRRRASSSPCDWPAAGAWRGGSSPAPRRVDVDQLARPCSNHQRSQRR